MKFINKAVVVFVIFGAISIIFLTWQSTQHSKDEDRGNEIREKELLQRVLIATESDKSKDSIVADIISQLKSFAIDIQVIEIDQLSNVKADDWSAIVILSAPENLTLQKEAPAFIENADIKDKIILLRTSGSNVAIVDIAEITTASMNEKITATPDEIVTRIKSIFNK